MKQALRHARFVFLLLLACLVYLMPAAASSVSASLTTTFASNMTYQGNMFNVTVQPEHDIVITAFDIHILSSPQPVPIRVYYREGSYQGYETNESAWTLLQDSNVISLGYKTPTPLPLDNGLPLSAGETYGFYITINANYTVSEMFYLHGASEYSNDHLSITLGASLSFPLFTIPYSPRTWNGTIYYNYPVPPPQTGDASTPFLWLGMAAAALCTGAVVVFIIQRSRKRKR